MRANLSVGEEVSRIWWSANSDITLCFSYVEIVKVDVRTGAHRNLLVARAPDTKYDAPFNCPVILGPLAAVGSLTQTYFLVNWEAQTSLVLLVAREVGDFPFKIQLL